MNAASPTDPHQRARAIDALRGWALLGIAIVNVPWIGFRASLASTLQTESTRTALAVHDLAAALFVEGLCEGRFYPIFSALFGFGTGLLLERGLATYGRRIVALVLFGLLHATFGWYGDVLLNYAAAGVLLALLAKLGPRPLLAIAALLFILTQLASLRYDTWMGPPDPARALERARYLDAELRVYRDGTFFSISEHRFREMLSYFSPYNWSYRLNIFAMATLGLALERKGLHRDLVKHRATLARLAGGLVALGLVLSVVLAFAPSLYIVAGDVLAGGYAFGFLWLATRDSGARWLEPFASVGRMALSCYILQTICFTLFFYGYGFRMYGELGPLGGVILSTLVYVSEALFATWWLRKFEYGPLEWVWRALTYLRWPRMLRAA